MKKLLSLFSDKLPLYISLNQLKGIKKFIVLCVQRPFRKVFFFLARKSFCYSAYEVKSYVWLFERPFEVSKNGTFLFDRSFIPEIIKFLLKS